MTGRRGFCGARPAAQAGSLTEGVLRRAQMPAVAPLFVVRPSLPNAPQPLAVGVAGAAFPAVAAVEGVLRRVPMSRVAGRAALGLASSVLGLGDRLEVVRVAAEDPQAPVSVVEHETVRDGAAQVLPDHAMHEQVASVGTADLPIAGAADRPGPQPMTAVLLDAVHDAIERRASGVDACHLRSLHPARAQAARHALYAVHCGYTTDPLSTKAAAR